MLYGYYNLKITDMIPWRDTSQSVTRSSQDTTSLKALPFRTESAGAFYSHRIVCIWNSLTAHIRTIQCQNSTIQLFKRAVYKYYLDKLSTCFDPDNACTWAVGCTCRCASCRPAQTGRFTFTHCGIFLIWSLSSFYNLFIYCY